MSEHVYEMLAKLKSKTFTQTEFDMVKQAAKHEARTLVNLWKFKPEIRILFRIGKFQSYLMLLLGVTVLPFTLYQKYQQDNQKLTKIMIFAPFGLAACLGPIIMYQRFSKKLIQAISYNFISKKIVLTRFRDGQQIYADLKDLSVTRSEKGRVKQLIFIKPQFEVKQTRLKETIKYQIEGLGEWQSSELFAFLLKASDKESL